MIDFKEFTLHLQAMFEKEYEQSMKEYGNPFTAADFGTYNAMIQGFKIIIAEINKEKPVA
jgi:hypothetical protein